MRLVAVYSRKGGVGKTATAVNLATLSARSGVRTLLIDLDPQAAATFTFRVQPKIDGGYARLLEERSDPLAAIRESDTPELDVLPADPSLRRLEQELAEPTNGAAADGDPLARLLRRLLESYELIWIDCPPTTSLLADSLFRAVDHLVVPTIPTTLSLRTLAQLMKHLKGLDPRPQVHPFFCMVDLRKLLHRRVIDWERETGLGFLETTVPNSSYLEQMSSRRAPVFDFAASSEAAKAYRALLDEIARRAVEQGDPLLWKKKTRRRVEDAVRGITLLPHRR